MPTILSSVLRAQMMLARPLLSKLTIESSRKYQDILGELGSKALSHKITYVDEPFDSFEASFAIPKEHRLNGALLYLHGGSYTAGSLSYAKGFGGILAEEIGIDVLCAAYRLAPEDPFPAGLDDAVTAYERLLERYEPGSIALIGESAGGGLVFALSQMILRKNLPIPSCCIAISPWVDLTFSGKSYKTNASIDPSLSENSLRYSANLYIGKSDPSDPLISPVFGDYSGLSDVIIFTGTHEILMDDTKMIRKRLKECGVSAKAHFEEGMWHAYVLFGTAEAHKALTAINEFISHHSSKAKQ